MINVITTFYKNKKAAFLKLRLLFSFFGIKIANTKLNIGKYEMKKPQDMIKDLIKLGFSQREISVHTQIPPSTICRILKGKHTNPRWQTVEALNSFLETVSKFDDENI